MAAQFSPSKSRTASIGCLSHFGTAIPACREPSTFCLQLAQCLPAARHVFASLLKPVQLLHSWRTLPQSTVLWCTEYESSSSGAHAHAASCATSMSDSSWLLQEQAGQDAGGHRRSCARRPRRPGPELVLHIDAAEGLQQVTAAMDVAHTACSSAVKNRPNTLLSAK